MKHKELNDNDLDDIEDIYKVARPTPRTLYEARVYGAKAARYMYWWYGFAKHEGLQALHGIFGTRQDFNIRTQNNCLQQEHPKIWAEYEASFLETWNRLFLETWRRLYGH